MRTQTEKLVTDVTVQGDDTEELVKATATQAGERVMDICNRVQEAVTNVKPQLANLDTVIAEKAKSAATTTDAYLHENPWTAVGVSAGIGLVIGLLIGRR